MPKVNFTDVEAPGEPLPNGTYLLNITKAEEVTAQSSGNAMIRWEFTVAEGEKEGRKINQITMLEPQNALFSLKGLLAATGKFTPEDLDGADLDFDEQDLIGVQVYGVNAQREYKGDMQNNITRYRKVDKSAEESVLP